MKKAIKDHKGNEFESIEEMCAHWNITRSMYYNRKRLNWTMEEILLGTGTTNSTKWEVVGAGLMKCFDHEGNWYKTIVEMCRYWHITDAMYYNRIALGWTIKEALTGERNGVKAGKVVYTDHMGNTFSSRKAMCERWGVSVQKYDKLISQGKTMKDALTINYCSDHLGNVYPSKRAMVAHWKILLSVFNMRVTNGWTIEEALTGVHERKQNPSKGKHIGGQRVRDHLGNEFISFEVMCEFYGKTSRVVCGRRRLGWTLEDALTTPVKKRAA